MIKKLCLLFILTFIIASCGVSNTPDANIDIMEKNGKKTFVWFVATWCPHCNSEVPVLNEFYNDYKDFTNMQLIVSDKKYFNGNFSIPQDTKNTLTYQQMTGEACDYVPTYVILDEEKNIIEKKCGATITYDELKTKLLGENFDPSSYTSNNEPTMQTNALENGDTVAVITTSNGTLKVKLFPEFAPKTVLNFMVHAQNGYYNNLIFHRVIKDFMIQGWDPEGTGMWGESIYWESFEDEFDSELKNLRGSLSMANAGANTNGSQFFINQKDNFFLDNKHSVFGQIVEWLENLDAIASVKTDANDKPEKDVKIIKIEIKTFENGVLKEKEKINQEEALKKIEVEITEKSQAKLKEEQTAYEAKQLADAQRVVKVWDIIQVHYTGKLKSDNSVFDSSLERGQPIDVEIGGKQMIPGFENGLIGMKNGEKKTIEVPFAEWYGEYSQEYIQEIPRAQLVEFEDAGFKIEVWVQLPTAYGLFEIKAVSDESVTIDLNHPLAWKDLIFDVEIVHFIN